MRPGYEAPDIDTTMAQRQAGAVTNTFVQFTSVRAVSSGAGTLSTGTRATKPTSAALNDFYYETDTDWLYYWGGTAWLFLAGMNVGSDATRAGITVSANDNGAWFFVTDTDTDMGLWQVSAGAWVKRFPDASIDVSTSYKVAGTKVVGSQGTAIADADGTLADATTKINSILARLRSHGLIAT